MSLLRAKRTADLQLYSDRLIHKLFQVAFHTVVLICNYAFTAQLITHKKYLAKLKMSLTTTIVHPYGTNLKTENSGTSHSI
jgi:hypothetical protein